MNLFRSAWLSLTLFAFAPMTAALADDACNAWQPWTCWKPAQKLAETGSRYRGVPAWSHQGGTWIGGLVNHEQRYIFANWPLQSVLEERGHSTQIFVQGTTPNAARTLLGKPLQGLVSEAFYDEATGQAIVRAEYPEYAYFALKAGAEPVRILDLPKESDVSTPGHWSLTPSLEADVLAFLECLPDNELNQCTVRFLSAVSFEETARTPAFFLAEAPYIELDKDKGLVQVDVEYWTRQGTLIVTDASSHAYEITREGTVKSIPVPNCTGPGTSSSRSSSTGVRVGIKAAKLDRVKNLAQTTSALCSAL